MVDDMTVMNQGWVNAKVLGGMWYLRSGVGHRLVLPAYLQANEAWYMAWSGLLVYGQHRMGRLDHPRAGRGAGC